MEEWDGGMNGRMGWWNEWEIGWWNEWKNGMVE